ncbi:MAG: YigZ family protein, partial [Deltaproteobacteria bacterium]|nr:YigZ family protein [Deltaproteobacteria bacterium]
MRDLRGVPSGILPAGARVVHSRTGLPLDNPRSLVFFRGMIELELQAPVRTLAGPCAFEEDVKKSRFLARAAAAHSPEEARAFLEAVREPGATHNCW